MPAFWILVVVLVLAAVGYVLGRRRAMAAAGGDMRTLHSLPNYYGLAVALATAAPALMALAAFVLILPIFAEGRTSSLVPETLRGGGRPQPHHGRRAPHRRRARPRGVPGRAHPRAGLRHER